MSALDLTVPVMQAPIGGCATPQLASAVSQTGGLGTLAASWTEPDVLRERIRSITRASDLPLADMEGDIEAMAMYAGESVSAIAAVERAAAIVERFAAALRTG